MPRKPRFQWLGVPQHIIQRGNNRQACFFDAADYQQYLSALESAANKYASRIHAYVLMTNHVHLLATPDKAYALSAMMQSVGRQYVRYVNVKYGRTGSLWEGRYKANLVDSERYLLTCYRYIELNPVRARMVKSPAEYRWSSYASNASGRINSLLSHHEEYVRLGKSAVERQAAYRALLSEPLDRCAMDDVRGSLNHELALGSRRFKEQVEEMTNRKISLGKPGRPKKTENKKVY